MAPFLNQLPSYAQLNAEFHLAAVMPRSRVYKCSTCGRTHEKPTGKHCQWVEAAQREAQDEPETQESDLAGAIRHLTAQVALMGGQLGDVQRKVASVQQKVDGIAEPAPDSDDEGSEDNAEAEIAPATDNPDVPSLCELRRNYEVGREVNRRLAEMDLEDDIDGEHRQGTRRRGKKSGAARTVQDTVLRDIDWPHFHIYKPPGAEPMTFSSLSVQEFVYGFQHMVDQPDARLDRSVMWDVLKGMMEDAMEYPWQNVRDFYWVVGSHIENNRLEWTDTDKVQKLRVKHAQKHEIPTKKQAAQPAPAAKIRYCGPFQNGTCQERGDHAGQRHICAHCYRTKKLQFTHPETECRRKVTEQQPKNAEGGGNNCFPPYRGGHRPAGGQLDGRSPE